MKKEFMTMKEAFECGDNDIPFIEGKFNISSTSKNTKKQILDNCETVSTISALSDQWQVIKTEPKVISAEILGIEFATEHENSFNKIIVPRSDIIPFVKKCRDNFRLERDLELRPLIEKVNRYMECPQCNDFSMVIENLKPLNN